MKKNMFLVVSLLVGLSMLIGACQPAAPAATEAAAKPENPGLAMDAAKVATQFYNDKDFAESLQLMKAKPINPDAPIYQQSLIDNKVDTAQYKKDAPYNICFSNAGVNNPWRVTGYVTMREQVEQLRAEGLVKNFYHVDAQGKDEKQIADIQDLISTSASVTCSIVSNTSGAHSRSGSSLQGSACRRI
jgi:ribose transport system substrate-binding protein